MKYRIPKSSVHRFGDELQVSVVFPDNPTWPTLGVRVPYPITPKDFETAINVKVNEFLQKKSNDEAAQTALDSVLNQDMDLA